MYVAAQFKDLLNNLLPVRSNCAVSAEKNNNLSFRVQEMKQLAPSARVLGGGGGGGGDKDHVHVV